VEPSAHRRIVEELAESARLKQWVADNLADRIAEAAEAIMRAYRNGGKVLFCGNGGSAAIASTLAAELVGRFRRREGLWQPSPSPPTRRS